VNLYRKEQISLNENFVSLSENLNFKLFNRLTFDVYFDMRMAFGHTLLDWKDTNKNFGLSVINHRCVLNMEKTTLGFRRAFLFLTQAISSYRRSNILFVSGLPAHDNFQDFLNFHQKNLPLLGHGYMLHWVAGLLTNMGTLIETFWGKAKTVVSRYQKQNKRDWFLEAAKGMRMFQRFPDFVVFFSISGIYEIAIKEASLLKIPTIAFVDSNCEVNNVPFSILGNDDSALGLEMKIFLFRELILRTMKFRLFTEIDKLLLEGKSLQQLMIDSFMEEFLKEISENFKNKLTLSDNKEMLPFSRVNSKNKITKIFLRFVLSYGTLLVNSVSKWFNYKFNILNFYKIKNLAPILFFSMAQMFCFTTKVKQKLDKSKFFWYSKNNVKNFMFLSNFNKFNFIYIILNFCFKNSMKISKRRLKILINCFFCQRPKAITSYKNVIAFLTLNFGFNSFIFDLFYFNRVLFNFLCNLEKPKLNSFVYLSKAKSYRIFLAFKKLKKNRNLKFILPKIRNEFSFKKYSSNFLQISDHLKKNLFLKSFFFWKIKKLHLKSRLKLHKLFTKYKHKFFGFLKYSRFLRFFPFLKSFFYKKFKRNKFSKHPTNALNICVFFLPKRFFFRRKRFLKSPPFLFKRYSKFFKIKREVQDLFPKIFPNFYDKKIFKVSLFRTKCLYKKKIFDFEILKKKTIRKFLRDGKKKQLKIIIKSFNFFAVWKFFFFF